MQIKKLAAKFLAAVLAASILTGFAALPLDASNEAQTLDYDALNQTLEEYKATGRANSIENLDAQLSAGQIDQATYNTQKGYVCLAQGNATVANLPVLDTYLDRVVEQMNGTPKDQANECLGNVPKSDIASEVFAGAGLGSFRFLTSVWYGTADTVASGITYNVTRIAAEAQDDGYLVSTFYVGCKPYTTQENTQMMVYAILYQKP
ncbi:MAG TPA: hypothetical protein H9771_06880 [Candidatus Faecalibacterium faecipullorum]|uniref:Uncharacterized protein n=1 Tax=Candidatus Faecalibacterium faecipullorum TaxID=2838578 RepID=A0A9D2MGY8_9FIRM|nr:hypothetical protein [Candidatus Faecalibacterium faecipullorum]